MANRNPFKNPYLTNACLAYSEQVGWYRQAFGKKGEMRPWYKRINKMKMYFIGISNSMSESNQTS